MSVDMLVKIEKPVEIRDLISATETNVAELLQLQRRRTLWVEEVKGESRQPIRQGLLEPSLLLVGVEGIRDGVELHTFDASFSSRGRTEEDLGLWASIAVGGLRKPIQFVLAPMVAIALARLSGTNIEDDSHSWSDADFLSSNELAHRIALSRKQESLESAVTEMYRSLPVSRHMPS